MSASTAIAMSLPTKKGPSSATCATPSLHSSDPHDTRCLMCGSSGNMGELLYCTVCGQHYHGSCVEVDPSPTVRAGWQCPECKRCQLCGYVKTVFLLV